jgi:tetratricopeptide (TPR) repeat protein
MDNLLDKYLFQAIDAYPYDLKETVESLQYALSYHPKNTKALCLMGQVYAEQLHDYEMAKAYYQEALAENIHAIDVYKHYIVVLLWNEDYKEAEKLINFAFTVKGIDKAVMYLKKAHLFEQKQAFKIAIKHLKKAKEFAYNSDFISYLAEEKSRIKDKLPKKKKTKHKKTSKARKKNTKKKNK